MRTMGVEEELLLVDGTGRVIPVAEEVLRGRRDEEADGPELTCEIQQEMIEVVSRPHKDLSGLLGEIREGRALAEFEASQWGAHAVALAASPLPSHPHPTENDRYSAIMGRYGRTARTSLTCGLHVHVSVGSSVEGVNVLDRIRVWLPLILALSCNSAIVDGEDTGYESFRFEAWNRWPVSGPTEVFGTARAYREFENRLLDSHVLLDQGMLYLDARLSRSHPTVEVRVADVCMDAEDSAALAAIIRALVETAAREWRNGTPPASVPATLLRLASWKSALCGVSEDLLHPLSQHTVSAREAVDTLLQHIRQSAEDSGDASFIERCVTDILARGTGSSLQRLSFSRRGDPCDVVADAIHATQGIRAATVEVA